MWAKYRHELKQKIIAFKQNAAKNKNPYDQTFFNSPYQAQLYWFDMIKDVVDTVKPYKTQNHRLRDFLQIAAGLRNILVGAYSLLFSSLFDGITNAYYQEKKSNWDYHVYVTYPLLNIVGHLSQIFRGLMQIATYPLVLLFRIPLRSYLSKDKPRWDTAQDRKSIQKLVAEFDQVVQEKTTPDETYGKIKRIVAKLIPKASYSPLYQFENTTPITRLSNKEGEIRSIEPDDIIPQKDISFTKRLSAAERQKQALWQQTLNLHAAVFDRLLGKPGVYVDYDAAEDRQSHIEQLTKYVGLFRKSDASKTRDLPDIQDPKFYDPGLKSYMAQ